MKTKKILIVTSAIVALMILGCFDTTRDNVFDPGGENYDPESNTQNTNTSNNENMEFGVNFKEVTYDFAGLGTQNGLNFTAVAFCNGSFVAATADNRFFQSNDGKTFRLRYHQNSDNYNGDLVVTKLLPAPYLDGFYILYIDTMSASYSSRLGFYQLPPDDGNDAEVAYVNPRNYNGGTATYEKINGGGEYYINSIATDASGNGIIALDNSFPQNDVWFFDLGLNFYDYGWAWLDSSYESVRAITNNNLDVYYSSATNLAQNYFVAVGTYDWDCGVVGAMYTDGASWQGDIIFEGRIWDIGDELTSVCYYGHLDSFFAVNSGRTHCVQITYSDPYNPGISTSILPPFLNGTDGLVRICPVEEGSFNRLVVTGKNNCTVAMNEDPADSNGWNEITVFEGDAASVTDVTYANLNTYSAGGKYIIAVTSSGKIGYSYKP